MRIRNEARARRLLTIGATFLLIVGLAAVTDEDRRDPDISIAGDAEGPQDPATSEQPDDPASPDAEPTQIATDDPSTPQDESTETPAPGASPTGPTTTPGSPGPGTPSPPPSSLPTTNPASPTPRSGWTSSGLFSPQEDRIGWTDDTIRICMHAAFLLGSVFDNNPDDEGVYWDVVNANGGVHGRQVEISFTDDGYTASGAREAMAQCDSRDPFLIMGGVGFDQTPSARAYAEDARVPYLHTMAVETGAENLKYSFTGSASIEDAGRLAAQLAARNTGKAHGILWVNSENWKAGRDAYRAEMDRLGLDVVYDDSIGNNNDDLTSKIVAMQSAGVEVLYFHANALAMSRFFVQADRQGYYPKVIGEDGFNLVTDTAGAEMTKFPPAEVLWLTPAFDKEHRDVPYWGEIEAMLDAYATYKPEKNVNDVDWMFWLAMKGIHQQLLDCGPNCTRNTLTGMMLKDGYRQTVTPACTVDYGRFNGHKGGYLVNLYRATKVGDVMKWRQVETCVPKF